MRTSISFTGPYIFATAMLAGTLISPTAVLAIPCNTGVVATCGLPLLAPGLVDPNWSVAYAGPSGPPIAAPPDLFSSAYANRNSGSWLATGPNSGWITPSQLADKAEIGGQYVYHTVFDGLDAFKGRYSTDNELLVVFLNGMLLTGFPTTGPTDFGVWTDFGYIGAGLVAVGNRLDFVVRNRGASCGVAGLPPNCDQDLNATVTGFRAEFTVPEPSVLGLCLMGLGSLVLLRRRPTLKEDPAPLSHIS